MCVDIGKIIILGAHHTNFIINGIDFEYVLQQQGMASEVLRVLMSSSAWCLRPLAVSRWCCEVEAEMGAGSSLVPPARIPASPSLPPRSCRAPSAQGRCGRRWSPR